MLFPICQIIYDLLKTIDKENNIKSVDSHDVCTSFDFENSLDFFCWMYKAWEESLLYFYKERGVFLLSAATYHKSRYKLKKKYYIKYPSDD